MTFKVKLVMGPEGEKKHSVRYDNPNKSDNRLRTIYLGKEAFESGHFPKSVNITIET